MQTLPPALAALASWAQFVTWVAVPDTDNPGKFKKFPTAYQAFFDTAKGQQMPAGTVIDAHDRQHWTTADAAMAAAPAQDRGHGSGVGFVFTEADPFFFHDLDSRLQADGQWTPDALAICERFRGAAVEISHSGRGLHIIGRYTGAAPDHGKRNIHLNMELYTSKRFVALTGTGAMGDAGTDHTHALHALAAEYFPPSVTTVAGDWTTEAVPEWSGPADDEELLRRMLVAGQRSANAVFGGAADTVTFADLWHGNTEPLVAKWPSDRHPFDRTRADQALANHLAFWTGKNCERMERLMRRSALVRDKYDSPRPGGTYLTNTITAACAYVGKVAQDKTTAAPLVPPPPPEVLAAAAATAGVGLRDPLSEYMGAHVQLEHFKGCYYLTETERVYDTSRNIAFTKRSFDVVHGGHMFILDPGGQKYTDSAFDAFTKSRVNITRTADDLCFRPEHAPGALVLAGNRALVNSYAPHHCRAVPGDVTKFVQHLERMLPDPHDRAILVNYMASLVQNPGAKFQWWPVLQGVKGNGKTLIITVLEYIVGEHYTHLPNAMAMARDGVKFNSWIYRKLFIGIEEVRVQGKWDFLEEFKAIITNGRLSMEPKGVDPTTRDNRANGMLCTNHKDGVPITDDERRYAVLYTAQQHKEDLARDGMAGGYFPDLYSWLKGDKAYAGQEPGLSYVAWYLKTLPIVAELDPAGAAHRAPETSSRGEAIGLSLGRVEQEILEAIDEGRPGFMGGWVSSRYLDALLGNIKANIPPVKRRALMQSIGYDWHPALKDGRTDSVVTPDNAKPKLFIRRGALEVTALTNAAAVQRAYSAAQVVTTGGIKAA